ncbi:hypothetical protein J7M23_09610 [Candidatus Sumerlaeota bacterium]|nr:hypothetical protein [Candidatus Sumerlaeota bacterium]
MRGNFDLSRFIRQIEETQRIIEQSNQRVQRISIDTCNFLRSITPAKTGETRSSIELKTKKTATGQQYEIYSKRADILRLLDRGTRRHFVFPIKRKALHWIDPVTGENRFSMGHAVSGIRAKGIIIATKFYLYTRLQRVLKVTRLALRQIFK